jgi:signal transduction histidine kinase
MSSRATEHGSLKSFTENASHEMQTPLAVIRTHTDLLLQGEHDRRILNIFTHRELHAKAIKTSQSLLLITKLETVSLYLARM